MKHDKDHNRMLARNMKYPRGRRSMIADSKTDVSTVMTLQIENIKNILEKVSGYSE